jgi:hypothetical protein
MTILRGCLKSFEGINKPLSKPLPASGRGFENPLPYQGRGVRFLEIMGFI